MAIQTGAVTSFALPNYAGMLFNKGNTRVPFSTMIGGKSKQTNSTEFIVAQEYTTDSVEGIPNISEKDTLTAPKATFITTAQQTNVTQIFHESIYIGDIKTSNMGTLAGVNLANQTANPPTPLDFQIAAKMVEIERKIENTFINGEYQKATSDSIVNKTRGIIQAITTNAIDLADNPITFWDVNDILSVIYKSNAPTTNLILWCDPVALLQLNKNALENNMTIVPASREVNGIAIQEIITPFGRIGMQLGEKLPVGTALLLNFDVISPVEQPIPGKGNFYLEKLAKVGAGEQYQILGQIGLDYGPEWYHGKFTNIKNTFDKPTGTSTKTTK